MIYGYTIYKTKTIGHGDFYWDEYYETQEYTQVKARLFNSKDKRDQEMEEEKTKYKGNYYNEFLILPFETENNIN